MRWQSDCRGHRMPQGELRTTAYAVETYWRILKGPDHLIKEVFIFLNRVYAKLQHTLDFKLLYLTSLQSPPLFSGPLKSTCVDDVNGIAMG